MMEVDILMAMFSIIVMFIVALMGTLVLIVLLLFNLLLYIFESVAFYSFAKGWGSRYPWAAWVPFVRGFIKGQIAGFASGKRHFKVILLLCGIMRFIIFSPFISLGYLSVIDLIPENSYAIFILLALPIGILIFIMEVIAAYHIFQCYSPYKAVPMTVLGAIPVTSFMRHIFLFAIRKKNPVIFIDGSLYPRQ